MQINYMMINSQTQLCGKKFSAEKEKLGKKFTFNFSGDFFISQNMPTTFFLPPLRLYPLPGSV